MRIVIKIGSNVLADGNGKISHSRLSNLVNDMVRLQKQGSEIVIVTSGAVASGRFIRPHLAGHHTKKIWAAIGQPLLMQKYISLFSRQKVTVAQCLLVKQDLATGASLRHFKGMMEAFFEDRVVPILNENDVIIAKDLIFGDNDALAALVAVAIKADRLILLTNQKGFFSGDPQDPKARLIPEVRHINQELKKMCAPGTSLFGVGGMASKLKSARRAAFRGITTHIADGRQPGVLKKIINGDRVGTKFLSRKKI